MSSSRRTRALPAVGTVLKGLQSQEPLKEKLLEVLLFVLSYQEASGDFLRVPVGLRARGG